MDRVTILDQLKGYTTLDEGMYNILHAIFIEIRLRLSRILEELILLIDFIKSTCCHCANHFIRPLLLFLFRFLLSQLL